MWLSSSKKYAMDRFLEERASCVSVHHVCGNGIVTIAVGTPTTTQLQHLMFRLAALISLRTAHLSSTDVSACLFAIYSNLSLKRGIGSRTPWPMLSLSAPSPAI
jgi:hypothetical protein